MIRILSDLHIGHPGCYIREVPMLTPLLEEVETLVLNGDSVEARFTKERPRGMRDFEKLNTFLKEKGVKPIFLAGNHDPLVTERQHLDLLDGRALVIHGDAFFPGLSPWSRDAAVLREACIAELAAAGNPIRQLEPRLVALRKASCAIEELGPYSHHQTVVSTVSGFLEEIWPPRRPWQMLKCWAEAPSRARAFAERFRPRSRVVIFGHTHRAGVWRTGGRVIVNTGSFLPFSGRLVVDITEDELIVRKIKRTETCFTLGKEVLRRPLSSFE